MSGREKIRRHRDGSDAGHGQGQGNGNRNGQGQGNGNRNGQGQGNGNRNGQGQGNGNRNGQGQGNGNRNGQGQGNGNRNGDGQGNGNGNAPVLSILSWRPSRARGAPPSRPAVASWVLTVPGLRPPRSQILKPDGLPRQAHGQIRGTDKIVGTRRVTGTAPPACPR